jgi:hypothetical protein
MERREISIRFVKLSSPWVVGRQQRGETRMADPRSTNGGITVYIAIAVTWAIVVCTGVYLGM